MLVVDGNSIVDDVDQCFVVIFIRYMLMSYKAKMVRWDFQFLYFLKTTASSILTSQQQVPLVCLLQNETVVYSAVF